MEDQKKQTDNSTSPVDTTPDSSSLSKATSRAGPTCYAYRQVNRQASLCPPSNNNMGCLPKTTDQSSFIGRCTAVRN